MAFWNASGTIQGARMRSESGSIFAPGGIASAATTTSPVWAASDGATFLAAWLAGNQLFVVNVDPVQGSAVGAPVELLTLPANTTPLRLWWDGTSYSLLISRHDGDEEVSAIRFTKALTLLDQPTTPSAIQTLPVFHGVPAVAATTQGHSLVAYVSLDRDLVGRVVRARLLDNDGKPAPVEPNEGGASPGGSSGLGGSPGGGGEETGASGGSPPSAEGGAPESGGGAETSGQSGRAPMTGGTASEGAQPSSGGATGQPHGAGASSGGASGSTASADGGSSAPSGEGCGCSVPTGSSSERAWLMAASLIGLLLSRRRTTILA